MTTNLTPQQMEAVVRHHVTALSEYFDAVQILVSVDQPDGTGNIFLGTGNWFARQGMAHEFINDGQG